MLKRKNFYQPIDSNFDQIFGLLESAILNEPTTVEATKFEI